MRVFLRRLLKVAAIAAWLLLVWLAWQRSAILAVSLLALGAVSLLLIMMRAEEKSEAVTYVDAADSEHAARYLVTRLLGDLTRVQVAYLSQDFAGAGEARAWLKQALPRNFRGALKQLYEDLERARQGEQPAGMRLALRVSALREELEAIDAALEEQKERYPERVLARPVAFVITESIDLDDEDSEPLVVSAAGWDPSRPTVLPRVDVVTLFSEAGGRRHIHGQLDFDGLATDLGARLQPVDIGRDSAIELYVTPALEEGVRELGVQLARLPVGFVVGDSEFL